MKPFIIAAALLASWPAYASQCSSFQREPVAGNAVVCSKTFYVEAKCGIPNFPGDAWIDVPWRTSGWEPVPISIVGASLNLSLSAESGYIRGSIGNGYTPDLILPLAAAAGNGTIMLNNHIMFPAGRGMPFFAQMNGDPVNGAHIDTHVDCAPYGAGYSGFVTIYYED